MRLDEFLTRNSLTHSQQASDKRLPAKRLKETAVNIDQ